MLLLRKLIVEEFRIIFSTSFVCSVEWEKNYLLKIITTSLKGFRYSKFSNNICAFYFSLFLAKKKKLITITVTTNYITCRIAS